MENIYIKLQKVRCEVQKRCTKKSGRNKFANFDYFELKDFLPVANEEFAKVGLCPVFNIVPQEVLADGSVVDEMATLVIHDEEGYIEFKTPSADPKMDKQVPIQNLGAKHTYLKRYLYMNALELAENDVVDATSGQETAENKKATDKQIQMIQKIYESKADKLQELLVKLHLNSLNDLSMNQASDLIKKLTAKTGANNG